MLHVVIGPPCSGKSTYVREHAKDGEVQVDFDRIAQALGSKSPHAAPDGIKAVTFAARAGAVSECMDKGIDAWIIHTSPTPDQMRGYESHGAEIVHMNTGMETCLSRAREDGRPDGTEDVIRAWFDRHGGKSRMPSIKSFAVKLNDGSDSTSETERTFEGYASTFDREPDSYGDVVAKGAFADTLKRHEDEGRRIPLLFGHVMDDPDFNLGYVDADEDEKGLHVVGHIFTDTPKGETVYKLLKRGQVYQMSFAYETLDEGTVTLEDGTKANELRKLDLYECSVVTVPANENAIIEEVKSMDSKAGRRNSKADEDVLSSIKEHAQAIIDAIDTLTGGDDNSDAEDTTDGGDGPDAQTEPGEGQADDAKAALAAYKQAIIDTL